MSVRISGLGVFPGSGRARVLWVGIAPSDGVVELQRACEAAAVGAGFDPERRPFQCHLTLGRWREPEHRPVLPPLDLGHTRFDRLVLFQSQLHPKGAVYTPLASFQLGRAGC
jgi:2'-5' RNA ligase